MLGEIFAGAQPGGDKCYFSIYCSSVVSYLANVTALLGFFSVRGDGSSRTKEPSDVYPGLIIQSFFKFVEHTNDLEFETNIAGQW